MSRLGFIGGSDVAAIIGISPFATAYELWLEKTGKPLDRARTKVQEDALYFGKLLEPVILQALHERAGIVTTARNSIYVDACYEWMRAEIDFEYMDDQRGESNGDCKSVNAFARKGWGSEDTDELPDYYTAQFLWGQGINGKSYTKVAALIGGSCLRTYGVQCDEEVVQFLREQALNFWERHVLADVPPPAQSREDAQRLIAKLPGFRWTPTEEIRTDIQELQRLKAEAKAIDLLQEKVEARILCAFSGQAILHPQGGAEGFVMTDDVGRKLASWNRQCSSRIDQGLLKQRHPEVAAACTTTSEFHVLRIAKEQG